MIILDTNVLSELLKPAPSSHVVRWISGQLTNDLHTTSITQAEILHGIMLLPADKRRNAFATAADAMFGQDFGGRIHSFDSDAAPPTRRGFNLQQPVHRNESRRKSPGRSRGSAGQCRR